MEKVLKIALVGCGQIADAHISEIQKLDNAQVVAVCDLEILMAEQASLRYGIPSIYDNYEEMLEKEKPDVVHIATPPEPHLALTKTAVDYGCHVYVEKPLTPTYESSVELIDYVKKHDKKLAIGWNSYFDPPFVTMREMINEGAIGNPLHGESFFGYNLEGSFGKAILGSNKHWVHNLPGKLFQNNIDHMVNKIAEFIDVDRPEVHAFSSKSRDAMMGDIRDDLHDELRVLIRGNKSTAYCTFSSHITPAAQFVRWYGDKAILHGDVIDRNVVLEEPHKLPSALGRVLSNFHTAKKFKREAWRNLRRFIKSDYHFFAGLNLLIRQYYDCILNDSEPPVPYELILKVGWIMQEIFDQINQLESHEERST